MLESAVVIAETDTGFGGGKKEQGKDDGKLWDHKTSASKSVNDGPRVENPGKFGEYETAAKSEESVIFFEGDLCKNMTAGSVADYEFYQNWNDNIKGGGHENGGCGTKKNGADGLEDGGKLGSAGFEKNQPTGIKCGKDEVDGENIRAGKISKKDK